MKAITYSTFESDIDKYLDQVIDDSENLTIVNNNPKKNLVVMSQDEFDSIAETMRITSNPELMDRIRSGDKQLKDGKFKEHKLN